MSQTKSPEKAAKTAGDDEIKVNKNGLNLPLARIKTIMKSSPDADSIAQDALVLVCKAAEMFIQELSREATKKSKKKTSLEYRDLAAVVEADDSKLEFLSSIIPKKITVREYKEIIANDSNSEFDSNASTSEEEESGSGESGSEEGSDEGEEEEEEEGQGSDVIELSSDEDNKPSDAKKKKKEG